ncbi:WD repeat-containing protein 24 [Teratosphaeria destructans]|uniref:WD repeat-containing protein 24 n=1 Tax=Teratosphaeria destructans TaxID=418781 RepID=A0A9W7SX53_9PEZI|nr:WD repeat-containing protein 24 [Teratosphaeria destructans]
MSHERRETTASSQTSIPNAPPLPVPRPLQRARDAAYRVFGYQSRPQSPEQDDHARSVACGRYASLGATQNATASHKTGLEIKTISINDSGTHAVLGGKQIFKTIKVEHGTCTEELNIRTQLLSNPRQASGQPRQIFSVDIADVAWAKRDSGDYVAAATESGKIILYNLGRAMDPGVQLHEHQRQVHRVTFNPHSGNLLLSGSQDGTVRLWDIRDARHQAKSLQSRDKYSGQSDGVRDVKWSPSDVFDFAFGTDGGYIQCWDFRMTRSAKVKIAAHVSPCNTVDWHPDGRHVTSGSTDKSVKVWNMSQNGRQKAAYELRTPFPVMNARWRPPCESSPDGSGARQCTQLLTAYNREYPVIHIWDLRRPSLPFREMCPYSTGPTDLLWHSQDLLWTVGREGVFLQADIQHAPKVIHKRNLQSIATSVKGDVSFIAQKRNPRRVPELPQPSSPTALSWPSQSFSMSPDTSFLSRSWADDTLDHSFLTVQPSHRPSKVANDMKIGNTGSTFDAASATRSIALLDRIMKNSRASVPSQVAIEGQAPYSGDIHIYKHLAGQYTMKVDLRFALDETFLGTIEAHLANNVRQAYAVGQYQLSQSWKLTSYWTLMHLKSRMQRQNTVPQKGIRLSYLDAKTHSFGDKAMKVLAHHKKSPQHTPASLRPTSTTHHRILHESTSNMATPRAKPVATNGKSSDHDEAMRLPDPDRDEQLTLPPSLHQHASMPRPVPERKLTAVNLSDFDKQSTDIKTDKIDMVRKWSVSAEQPLKPQPDHPKYVNIPPKLVKHDSDESFTFLAASTDSRGSSGPASFVDEKPSELVTERPSRIVRISPAAIEATSIARKALTTGDEAYLRGPRDGYLDIRKAKAGDEIGSDAINGFSADAPPERPNGVTANTPPPSSPVIDEEPHSLPDDPQTDLEEGKPFTLCELLLKLVSFYAGKSDAQTASTLLTLIAPLLPTTHPLTRREQEATIVTYGDAYINSGFTEKQIRDMFDKHLRHTIMAGLQPLQIEAILATYHEQLVALGLLQEAAHLRALAYPAYPAVYEDYTTTNRLQVDVHNGPCSFCWDLQSRDGRASTTTICFKCHHGGHAGCMREWFEGEKGQGCPTGCGCICVV